MLEKDNLKDHPNIIDSQYPQAHTTREIHGDDHKN